MAKKKKSSKRKKAVKHSSRESNTKPVDNEQKPSDIFGKLCFDYMRNVGGLTDSLPIIIHLLIQRKNTVRKNLDSFIELHSLGSKEIEGGLYHAIKDEYILDYDELHGFVTTMHQALDVTPRSFLVSLVSKYDTFLGSLISQMFHLKPELLNATDSSLTYSSLKNLNSINEALKCLVDKDVNSLLNKSHSEHFDWFERKFSISISKKHSCWSQFFEIIERRNLFVHSNGIVSTKYINVCRNHSISLDENVIVGTQLSVNPPYFERSSNCLVGIGIRLTQNLWRQIFPDDDRNANEILHLIIYHALLKQNYGLAADLSEFGTEIIRTFANDEDRLKFAINSATAYKFGNEPEKFLSVLEPENWDSTTVEFQLAVAVLLDDYSKAADIMRIIGGNQHPTPLEYREWPVFKEFRKSHEFAQAYKDIFGEDFIFHEQNSLDNNIINKEIVQIGELKEGFWWSPYTADRTL